MAAARALQLLFALLATNTDALKIAGATTRRATVINGGLVALLPLPAIASMTQEPANLKYGGDETDAVARNAMSGGVGPALYDEVAKAQRLKGIMIWMLNGCTRTQAPELWQGIYEAFGPAQGPRRDC